MSKYNGMKAHFTASQPYYAFAGEKDSDSKARRRDGFNKIKSAGFKEQYFQFTVGNDAEKSAARIQCETLASEIVAKTGVVVKAQEGCFL